MPESPPAGHPERTWTGRGLPLLILALALALAAGLAELVLIVGAVSLVAVWRVVFLFEDAVGFAALGLGLAGLWALWRGRLEYGASHAASVRRSAVAFVLGAVSVLLLLLTGLSLGYGFLPAGGYVESVTFPLVITVVWLLQLAHHLAYVLIAAFVGLLLLGMIWRLGTPASRWIGLAALLVGVLAPLVGVAAFLSPIGPGSLPVIVFYAAWFMPTASSSLWLLAYVLVASHLRGAAPFSLLSPATT